MNFPDRLTIHVTDRHIGTGVCSSPSNCPIALAVIDALDPLNLELPMSVDVGSTVWLTHPTNNHRTLVSARYNYPKVARDFIDDFDGRRHVTPISFEMELDYQSDSRN
jgi:hypothetical protein